MNNNGTWDIAAADSNTDFLNSGENEKELWKWAWAATRGTHKYEICADATSSISEADETNNCVSKIFTVP